MTAETAGNRPRYAPLMPEPRARTNLLVADTAAIASEAFAPGTTLADWPERWHVVAHALVMPEPFGGPGVQQFRAPAHLLSLLRHRLAAETMGLRLYAVGREPFVWDVARVAFDAGMGREEIGLYAIGEPERRVSCVHCRTITPQVTTTLVACAGCGVTLTVRDHFSRHHNTWMGVQCDAEVPGELPAVEDLAR